MKITKKNLIVSLLSLFVGTINAQNIPTKALDLSSLASNLGETLSEKNVPSMSKADINTSLAYKSTTAKRLASVFKGEEEKKTKEKLYNLALFSHQQSEKLLGIQQGDLYGPLAAYLYENWAFVNNKTIPDSALGTMVNNVRDLLKPKMQSTFDKASKADIKLAYEEFAIVGCSL